MYRELINQSIEKVYQAGVAAKILQYMNKIRNESDITQARRWVMELLQNARDLAWEDTPLQVQIELKEEALIFRHSGQPFKVKDILSIVNQVSSKNPGEGVGQFGTWQRAWDLMLSCGPDDGMYELCEVWYRRELPEREKIEDERFSEHLWRSTYCSVLESTVNGIAACSELSDLGIDPPYQWLNGFYGKCSHYLREIGLIYYAIFPDQEGRLRRLSCACYKLHVDSVVLLAFFRVGDTQKGWTGRRLVLRRGAGGKLWCEFKIIDS